MTETSYNENEKPELKFNLGISFLQRIHAILTLIVIAREKKEGEEWLNHLISLHLEIKAAMNPTKQEEIEKIQQECITIKENMIKRGKGKTKMDSELWKHCYNLENSLKKILHEDFDLLMPKKGIDDMDMA